MTNPSSAPAGPMGVLHSADADVASSFQSLRAAAEDGPLDQRTIELVLIGALAAQSDSGSLRVHARRAVAHGANVDEITHAVLVTLGTTTVFGQVVSALKAIADEALA